MTSRTIKGNTENTKGDGEGLIGIVAHELIGGFDAIKRFVADPANHRLATTTTITPRTFSVWQWFRCHQHEL